MKTVESGLAGIENNLASRRETDRIMWFSMWFLLSLATFGVAWFLMLYFLIKRRNTHFARQERFEAFILNKLHVHEPVSSSRNTPLPERNARVWVLSTLLVLPGFYVFYFLINDLSKHEEREHEFLMEFLSIAKDLKLSVNLDSVAMNARNITLKRYVILTLGTFGFAAVYWLFRIFNDYNSHFKTQWKLEDELLKAMKSLEMPETS